MTIPRPGRRSSFCVPAPGRTLLASGLLLVSLLAFARSTRGDVPLTPEPAGGPALYQPREVLTDAPLSALRTAPIRQELPRPVLDLSDQGLAPLFPASGTAEIAADPLGLAGTRLALLDVAPALAPFSAQLQPASDTLPEAVALTLTSPMISGLTWRSGSTPGGYPCLAQMRGRPLDVITTFVGHDSFPAMVRQTDRMQSVARLAPLWVVSLPLLPSANKRDFAQCAGGAFDRYFREIGANLRSAGARGIVVRLGWEANIGSDSHPWGVDNAGQIPAYKACWRRAAAALKAGGSGVLVEWTNAKKTSNRALHVLDMYPGDGAVDLWGVHYYDSGPQKNTQKLWDEYYNTTYNNGPWGIGAWLKAAKAHGKKLGVAEWGLWHQDGSMAAADDPVYIDNMYRFFRANASSIAYETYFNAKPDEHLLCPKTHFPKAAVRYKANWGR